MPTLRPGSPFPWMLLAVAVAVWGCGAPNNTRDGGDASRPNDAANDTAVRSDAADVADASADASDDVDVGADTGDGASTPCTEGSTRACYSGPAATDGVGSCHPGTQYCHDGAFGPCSGDITPVPETCNGEDDDCNGVLDDRLAPIRCGIGACERTVSACTARHPATCVPGAPVAEICGDDIDNDCNGAIDDGCPCVNVAPTGNDATGTGSPSAPFRTLGRAIAAAGTSGRPNIVCVASGATCPSTFDYAESVAIRNGVHVLGGYRSSSTTWTRVPGCVTRIVDQDARGVFFDETVTAATSLDGFTIVGYAAPTTAAITVRGSRGAIITHDVVMGADGATSYGIDVVGGAMPATPRIAFDTIRSGRATTTAVGVHSVSSAPVITSNCDTFDAVGRCAAAACIATGSSIGASGGPGSTGAYGVFLESSPGSIVDSTGACADGPGEIAAVRWSGDARGVVVRRSLLRALVGGSGIHAGVWADPCGGEEPRIEDNTLIASEVSALGATADGVRAVGDCHPLIAANLEIRGPLGVVRPDANGVHCLRDMASGVASRCAVIGNVSIGGGGLMAHSAGIRCDDGACSRIQGNARITGVSSSQSYGIVLGATGTLVDGNHIEGGCGETEAAGILAQNSFARIQNNVVQGNSCMGRFTAAGSYAVRVLSTANGNEIDVHSNMLFGAGVAMMCSSAAIAFDVLPGVPAPTRPLGIVRNNVLAPGQCPMRYDIVEQNAAADPRLIENNDFWFAAASDPLYRDEASTDLTTVPAIAALTDIAVAANFSGDPMLTADYHLGSGSPCIDTGTASGAPRFDFDLQLRPAGPGFDVGSDEADP